jgi:hypothetical protein
MFEDEGIHDFFKDSIEIRYETVTLGVYFDDAIIAKESNVSVIVTNQLERMYKETVMSQSMHGDLSYSSEQSYTWQ